MARWRGIFGRKAKREAEATEAGVDPVTALYPSHEVDPAPQQDSTESGAEDWEPVDRPRPVAIEPDTGTAEWAPPSRVDSRRPAADPEPVAEDEPAAAEPAEELEPEPVVESRPGPTLPEESSEGRDQPEPTPENEPDGPDTGERIQVAAAEAARAAEIRSHDEIAELEKNVEQAREAARAEVEQMAERVREAEARAREAEERADLLAVERDEVQARARDAATQWLRGQVATLKAEAQEQVRGEVERIKAAGEGPGGVESAELEGLRSELALAREEAHARIAEAREEGKREALGSGGDADERLAAARAAGRAEAEAEMERREEPRRRELEKRALAAAEAQTKDRIARVQADADERIRAEVAVARKAAEERFSELLSERERALQSEREAKVEAIGHSHERLAVIERHAVEAAERVGVAEQELEIEKTRLQEASAAELEVAIEQAKAVAEQTVSERLRDRKEELDDALAATVRAEKEAGSKVADADRRAAEAEAHAKAVEAEAAAAISEVRRSAADWLRGQTAALRAEAIREAQRGSSGN